MTTGRQGCGLRLIYKKQEALLFQQYLLSLSLVLNSFSGTEQKGNAPKTGQGNDGVDDAAYEGVLSAEDPGYEIKLKQANAAPVDGTDDHEDQGNSVHNHAALLRRLAAALLCKFSFLPCG